MYEITKEFKFEMAHTLTNYEGSCGNLHGHSYRCLLTFSAPNNSLGLDGDEGMVLDFNNVKRVCSDLFESLDHCYAYNEYGSNFELGIARMCNEYGKKIFCFPFRTTAENMSRYIFEEVNNRINKYSCRCSKVVLYETVTGCATYFE